MSLPAHLLATLRAGIVDARVEAPATTVAVLGPNASGKTTMLRAIAGLLTNDGEVVIAGRDVSHLPAAQRRVGYVPQGGSLFSHLDVASNVAYGVRSSRRSRGDARAVAAQWLERLDIADLARRRPVQLSGGQAQRVALARALATDPEVLLLDEPLSALDVTGRSEVRAELRRHLASFGGTALVVSHDPSDAWELADLVIVLEEGQVVQHGRFGEVAERPASVWLARLLGLNAWSGVVAGSTVTLPSPTGDLTLDVGGSHPSGPVTVTVPPSRVTLEPEDGPATGIGHPFTGRIRSVERHGDRILVHVDAGVPVSAEVASSSATAARLREGANVRARVAPADVTLAPRAARDTLGTPPDPPRAQEDE